MFDVLVIGGGPAGVSCALVLGSAYKKEFVTGKRIGILTHQKTSNLNEALINNAYGIAAGTSGADLLERSLQQLSQQYPHVIQIPQQKVLRIDGAAPNFNVTTNTDYYEAAMVVIATGWINTFAIEGLLEYIEPHGRSIPEKQRIQLKNNDHKVAEGIYVAGTLAGWRSQLAIVAGSGAAVATDILTLWNNGINSQSHDSMKKPIV